MPPTYFSYDGGWFECDYCGEPTDRDSVGCDGLYISEIRIRWNHWRAWWLILPVAFCELKRWWRQHRCWRCRRNALVAIWKWGKTKAATRREERP